MEGKTDELPLWAESFCPTWTGVSDILWLKAVDGNLEDINETSSTYYMKSKYDA